MKAPNLFIAAIILFTAVESCHHFGGRTTTIVVNNNNIYKKVKYEGTIVFTTDKTGIERMSPNAYFEYKTNNDALTATSDSRGIITYEFYGNTTTQLNAEGKQVLQQAIQMISEQQAKQKPVHI